MSKKRAIVKIAMIGLAGFLGVTAIKSEKEFEITGLETNTEQNDYQGLIQVYFSQGEKISIQIMGKVSSKEGQNIYQAITSPEIYLIENYDKGKFTYELKGKGTLSESQKDFLENAEIYDISYVIGSESVSYLEALDREQKYDKAYAEVKNSTSAKELCYTSEEGETVHRVVVPTIIANKVAYTTVTEPKVNVISMGVNNYWLQTKDNTPLNFIYMCTFIDVTIEDLTEESAAEIEESLNQANKKGRN